MTKGLELELEPAIGMGGSIAVGSDSYAVTVIDVQRTLNKRMVRVQYDNVHATKDSSRLTERQVNLYTPNPKGRIEIFTYRKKSGNWVPLGQSVTETGVRLHLGERVQYLDPSF